MLEILGDTDLHHDAEAHHHHQQEPLVDEEDWMVVLDHIIGTGVDQRVIRELVAGVLAAGVEVAALQGDTEEETVPHHHH